MCRARCKPRHALPPDREWRAAHDPAIRQAAHCQIPRNGEQTMQLTPDDIIIGKRMRPLNAERIADLERSIAAIGLQTPITIRYVEGRPTLIAGAHRLQAVKNLGWSAIAVREFDGDEREARMWEIAENLHRAELTVLEHDDSSPSGSGWPKRFRCKLTQNHKAVVPRAALN